MSEYKSDTCEVLAEFTHNGRVVNLIRWITGGPTCSICIYYKLECKGIMHTCRELIRRAFMGSNSKVPEDIYYITFRYASSSLYSNIYYRYNA